MRIFIDVNWDTTQRHFRPAGPDDSPSERDETVVVEVTDAQYQQMVSDREASERLQQTLRGLVPG